MVQTVAADNKMYYENKNKHEETTQLAIKAGGAIGLGFIGLLVVREIKEIIKEFIK